MRDVGLPDATGKGVPGYVYGLALLQTADLRLIDERPHSDVVQISDLNQKVARRYESVLTHG
jgi:hypothetical protein